jgi:hypothetical protein
MAKSSVQRIEDIGSGIKHAESRMQQIVNEVLSEEREKKRLNNPLLLASDEQIVAMVKRVDDAAREYWALVGNVHTAQSFVPLFSNIHSARSFASGRVDYDLAVDGYNCAHFGDTIKKVRADRIKASLRGDELPSAEIARRVAEIDAKITALWAEYEKIAVTLEESNLRVERDARLPVTVFLELDSDASTINRDKLDRLRRRRSQHHGEDDSIRHELAVLQSEETAVTWELDEWNRNPRRQSIDLNSINARLATISDKMSAVRKKQTELANSNTAAFKLLGRCEQFVKEHHLEVKRLGLAEGIVRG